MRVSVRLFAALREVAGSRLQVELGPGSRAADAWSACVELFPGLRPHTEYVRVARNAAYAAWDVPLADGDEVAFLPPVSGGSGVTRLTDGPINLEELEGVADQRHGAVVRFVGRVRGDGEDGRSVVELEYEAYPEMAEAVLREIVCEAEERWQGSVVAAVHRTGRVPLGEPTVAIVAAAPHRAEAYEANRYVIEEIKRRLPLWKRERFVDR